MQVLVINGHPRKGSLSEALAHAYAQGAEAAGLAVTRLNLYELAFDPNVTHVSAARQSREPAIRQAQALISQAQHVVFVYPTWWGSMPALLKGFIDRVLTPGFAFEETTGGSGYAPLLRGKSAQLITTMDTPLWVYRWIYRSPGHQALGRATLQFCGFQLARTLSFGPVKSSDRRQRQQWLSQVQQEGFGLRRGAFTPAQAFTTRLATGLQALRLQFYPMTGLAYATGAMAAAQQGYGFLAPVLWWGLLWLVLVEAATVLSNEYFDYATDRDNKCYGPFTGGSRVLAEGLLRFSQIRKGIFFTLGGSLAVLALLLGHVPGPLAPAALSCATVYVLALGYTVPPLRLCYRGLGELDVALTHSFALVLCGYIFQGGQPGDAMPWLLALPLCLAVLPSIILAGIPDFGADQAAGKRTLTVRWGRKNAALLALAFTWLSAGLLLAYRLAAVLPQAFGHQVWAVVPHAGLLTVLLWRYLKREPPPPRIDGLLLTSLTYLLWFTLIPFWLLVVSCWLLVVGLLVHGP